MYAHCRGPEKPPALVTAAIDTIDIFRSPETAEIDMEMRAAVTHVGSSSLNVDMDLCSGEGMARRQG